MPVPCARCGHLIPHGLPRCPTCGLEIGAPPPAPGPAFAGSPYYAAPKRRPNGCAIALAITAVCVLITVSVVFFAVRAFNRLPGQPGEPGVGAVGTLNDDEETKGKVILSRTPQDRDAIADVTNDAQGQKLYDSGRAFIIPAGTGATVLGKGVDAQGELLYHVRLLNGDQKGRDGWVLRMSFVPRH